MASAGQDWVTTEPILYESSPPEWLPELSNNADLGYINFFPPRPSQDSDVLTEHVLKQGLALKPVVSAETFISRSKQIESLKDANTVRDLEDFMGQIFRRRVENASAIPPSTFRIPSRTTLNDSKRNAWFADLANPAVPLSKLAKSIPHGARNQDLLDHLHANNVEISRAVWLIRAFGSNETAGVRNKQNYNPMQYSVDWANVVTAYLKKQLAEVILPSAPRPGLSIRQTFRGVLGDPETRERWVSKFTYTIDLLRVFYLEFMVDHTTFLAWLVQTLSTSNLAQAAFVTRLAEDYLDEMYTCRALLRPFVDACLTKLQEINNSTSKDTLEQLQARIERLLRRVFLTSPSVFVSPRTWKAHSETIQSIMLGFESFMSDHDEGTRISAHRVQLHMQGTLQDVEKRNEALLFRNNTQPVKGPLRSMVSDVLLLNQITSTTDLLSIPFFTKRRGTFSDPTHSDFAHKLHLLLSWSVCYLQYGDHRPHAAVSLLLHWRAKAAERATRRRDFASRRSPDSDPTSSIQGELFSWLDANEEAKDERNARMVSILFGEMIQKGLFEYDKYVQRLIARGEVGLAVKDERGSPHRTFLRIFPIYTNDPALVNQRRFTLYGVTARSIPEDEIEKQMKSELQGLLPEIFKGSSTLSMPKQSIAADSILRTACRYEQIRVVRLWFMPNVLRFFQWAFSTSPENPELVLRIFCTAIDCLDAMKCYRRGLELALDVLKSTATTDLLMTIVDHLKRGLDMWVCMDAMHSVIQALLAAHQKWKSKGVHIRCLANFLLELDDGRYLDAADRQAVIEDSLHFAQALVPVSEAFEQMPRILSDVLLLAQNFNPDAPSSLANALWYKYRNNPEWAYVVWDNVMTSVREVPSIITDAAEQRACAVRYAKFLLHIDLHSTDGINGHALNWFVKSGFEQFRHSPEVVWDVASHAFMYLTVHGALGIMTLLQGLVYPTWQLAAMVEDTTQAEELKILLAAVNKLCKLLLVDRLSAAEDGLPPSDLLEMQKLKTRRRDVYRDGYFVWLIQLLPILVFIEQNEHFDEALRKELTDLRRSISCKHDFRLGGARHVSAVVDAFANALSSRNMQEKMHEHLIAALRLVFNDPEEDERACSTAFLSTWKLSSSAAVTSFVIQQIGQRMTRESTTTKAQAEKEARKLAAKVMYGATTAEQADFVSEMVRGATASVAGEFVNRGLQRIADVFNETTDLTAESLVTLPEKAGHFLKLLSAIMQPLRRSAEPLHAIEEPVRDALVTGITITFVALKEAFNRPDDTQFGKGSVRARLSECTLFLARLLQFFLGFPDVWKGKLKAGDELLMAVLDLALLHGQGLMMGPIAFTLLLDTVFYVFDELPPDMRQPPNTLFLHCPALDLAQFSYNMPRAYRELVGTLLKHKARNALTDDLIYVGRDSNGDLQHATPVQMRPWEWMEYLGDTSPSDPKETDREAEGKSNIGVKRDVRNNTSIPLELFGWRGTGEGMRSLPTTKGASSLLDTGEQLRSLFEDDFASESIYERHWRDSRILEVEPPEIVGNELRSRHGTPGSFRASPALSVHTNLESRSSAGPPLSAASSSHRTQSPAVSNRGDPMDVDLPLSAVSTKSKRKATAAGLPVDEPKDSSTAGNDGSRRGKQRSVAVKSTASKTTGKTTRKRK